MGRYAVGPQPARAVVPVPASSDQVHAGRHRAGTAGRVEPAPGRTDVDRAGAPAALGLTYQLSGDAMWSIIFGVASIAVPIFTPIYFPILPIFGVWRGVLAVRRRRVLGGVIGLVV